MRDELWFGSNHGTDAVDLAAPGRDVLGDQFPLTDPFREGFDLDLAGRWNTGGVHDSWGRVARLNGFALSDSPDGPYRNGTDSWIGTVSPIDLSGTSECELWYRLVRDLASGDVLRLSGATTPGGPWAQLGRHTGQSSGRPEAFDDLGPLAGQGAAYLRFQLLTDAAGRADGVQIDRLAIHCVGTPTGDEVLFLSGTSMATPHVSGVAALVWSVRPAASVADVKNAILGSVDPLRSLGDRTITGGRLNAAAALDATCTVVGAHWDDVFDGGSGDDDICALGGDDVVAGNAGSDHLAGHGGRDRLLGGPDDDVLEGGPGADDLTGHRGADAFEGGPGDDRIDAQDGVGGETVDGGAGDDTCIADLGDVLIDC